MVGPRVLIMDDQSTDSWLKWLAIIVGMVLAFVLAVVLVIGLLAEAPPFVALTVIVLAFLAWVGVRMGYLTSGDETEENVERDPLTVLQERYAAGEISEAEFEHRLERILESDELVEKAAERPDWNVDHLDTEDVAVADVERELDSEK